MLEVTLIKDEIKETCLRCFDHVQRRHMDGTVRKMNCVEVIGSLKERRKLKNFGRHS